MADDSYDPMLRVPLGLKPSLKPRIDAILRRSRGQLRLLHSGQQKLDALTDDQYLQGARLIVEEDQYILVAPIPDASQGDLAGYPKRIPPLAGDRFKAANQSHEPGEDAAQTSQPSPISSGDAPDVRSELGLDAALDDLLREAAGVDAVLGSVDTVALEVACTDLASKDACSSRTDDAFRSKKQPPAPGADAAQEAEHLDPMATKRLTVDQALNCIEASASMSTQVAEILATSSNLVGDVRELERRTGLSSAGSRYFIATRQQELVVEVDGYRVAFVAPPVRNEVADKDVVQIQVRLVPTRAENDVLRVDVLEAKGVGVHGGVTTLGAHDVRYTRLDDFRRGILLILRGAGQNVGIGVKETISTTRLLRNPALVVDPGDWAALKQLAIEALLIATMPGRSGGKEANEEDAGLEAGLSEDLMDDPDGREGA